MGEKKKMKKKDRKGWAQNKKGTLVNNGRVVVGGRTV